MDLGAVVRVGGATLAKEKRGQHGGSKKGRPNPGAPDVVVRGTLTSGQK